MHHRTLPEATECTKGDDGDEERSICFEMDLWQSVGPFGN